MLYIASLIPRLSLALVFDHLYTKKTGASEGLGMKLVVALYYRYMFPELVCMSHIEITQVSLSACKHKGE